MPAKPEKEGWDIKLVSFVIIGVITLLYVIFELVAAIYIDSLVLLSDGFHNLSDVVALYIAYWAQKARKKESSGVYSYGWGRSEILGGLINGCFLLSLCMYVALECIPKFVDPQPLKGLEEEDSGNVFFLVVAGSGLAINTIATIVFLITGNSHGHSHGSHSHSHSSKKSDKLEMGSHKLLHGHEHEHGHGHGHRHGHEHEGDEGKGHSHKKRDLNVHAVFLHYLGDAISSFLVLIAGLLIHFFRGKWVLYIDPVSSLIIIIVILWTTVPLVKHCSFVLLQTSPPKVDVTGIRDHIQKIEGVITVHDLHVWELVDDMTIGSVHIGIEEGVDFSLVISESKKIFHENGIHSITIQPEIVPRNQTGSFCEENCVKDCEEEWCCQKDAQRQRKFLEEFSITTDLD